VIAVMNLNQEVSMREEPVDPPYVIGEHERYEPRAYVVLAQRNQELRDECAALRTELRALRARLWAGRPIEQVQGGPS
jgi:hypothetical protein